ncbi:site-specific integrase [Butyricimonas faecihominis]|uniref:site-specific integrase n=1 Tax=Butyricimonas faecihominis TaxID=1472416 RepID=UPI0032BF59BC
MNASVSVVCYKSKVLSNGESPLMLRVIKDRKPKYVSLGISILPKYWDFEKNRPTSKCPNKELIEKIILDKQVEYQRQILEFVADQKEYTAALLVESKKVKLVNKTVGEFYKELLVYFRDSGNEGNRLVYKYSYNSLRDFTSSNLEIPFSSIDVAWLKRYESWLVGKKCKGTTLSVLFRTLRSAFNRAIEAKIVNKKYYPFEEYKVSKFDTSTRKRALSKEDMMKIITTETINTTFIREFARDVFIFAYLSGGISLVDMANLTSYNIYRGRLRYHRQKTHGAINFKLCEQAKEIIEKYASYQKEAGYLFPIYDNRVHKTSVQKKNRLHKMLAKINKELKLLASELEIDADVTTYVARHSFASVLKNTGVNIALISQALGHQDIKTTEIYLSKFDDQQMDEAMSNLL